MAVRTAPLSNLLDLLGVRFIKSSGVALPQSRTLNFTGSQISADYNPSTKEIDVTVVEASADLAWIGYRLDDGVYSEKRKSVSSEETAPQGVAFSSDGTKMYLVGSSSDAVQQYTLSKAWDVGTSSYDSVSLSVLSEDGNATGLAFSADGTKMYVCGADSDSIHQYTLSTAWDLNTGSYDSVSIDIGSEDSLVRDVAFSSDGTKMFMLGSTNDTAFQYTLSTAWDVGTGSYDSVSLSVTSEDTSPRGFAFSSDGNKMFISGTAGAIFQYTLPASWDLTAGSYDSVSLTVSTEDSVPEDVTFSSDGTKMYTCGSATDMVYQYYTSRAVRN